MASDALGSAARRARDRSGIAVTGKRALRRAGITRARLAAMRTCCERNAGGLFGSRGAPRDRILCYHSVGTPQWGVNDVSPARFREQIEAAVRLGYVFAAAEAIAAGPAPAGSPPRLAITFDDALTSVATNAAPILAEFGAPWSVYVVTDWADGRHPWGDDTILGWRDLERLAAAGATIGSHSVTHARFRYLTPGEAEAEVFGSRERIQRRLGITPTGFAIPMGQSRDWPSFAHDAALRAGYRHVFAQSEDRRAPGTVARTFVTRYDHRRVFERALGGAFDRWEEWV